MARSIIETFSAIALIKIHVLLGRPLRKWRTTWGTTAAERQRTYPGDELLTDPKWSYSHAVTINAGPSEVWPWIVQLGQGRGGFYSYQALENLVGCRITNVGEILPRFQHLEVGDAIRLHPKAPPIPVALVEPERHLVLFASDAGSGEATVWGFHLLPLEGGRTRLIERGGSTHGDSVRSRLAFGRMLLEPISFVMSRKMLLTIKDSASASRHDRAR
ncbi:hypothetical protein HT102_09480 [Hoyosella sp. G463]|uniref:SRPBCC family protein n=1 Tax=Lolliginicoccus lacisalsi TaxID=2742202 RepID=A0A927JCW0_9ACTN|nr:hypothetical protein [Lolliginicoccus lacisalsi]